MTRLLRLRVIGFGMLALPETSFDFVPDRVNLIVGDNETGKTTLAEALFASLYGLEHRRHVKYVPLSSAERWRPWPAASGRGNPATPWFATELCVLHEGREIVALWDFDAPTLRVTDALTGADLTEKYRTGRHEYDLAEQWLGLGADEFRKVCFIGQGRVSDMGTIEGIAPLVQRFAASTAGEGTTAADAIRVLEQAAREYEGTTGKGTIQIKTEIERLSRRKGEICATLDELQRERAQAAEEEERYEEVKQRERELQQKIALARHLQHKAELDEARAQLQKAEEADTRLEALKQERDSHRRNLEGTGLYRHATEEDRNEAAYLLATVQELRTQLAGEEEKLAGAGVSPAQLLALKRPLARLSEAELEEAARYPTDRADISARLQTTAEAVHVARDSLLRIQRARRWRKMAGLALLVLGATLLALIAILPMGFHMPPLMTGVGVAVAALLFLGGLLLGLTASSARADEYDAARKGLEKSDEQAAQVRREQEPLEKAMTHLARAAGFPSAASLGQAALALREAERKCARLVALQEQRGLFLERSKTLAGRFEEPLDESDLAACLKTVRDRIEESRRLQEKARKLEDESIPQAQERIAPPDLLASWKARIAELEPRIAQEERERPEFARTRPELPPSGYADELEHLTRELADAARERETTAIAVWETLARWQKEAPALQEELAAVEEGLQRALRRQKALEIALEELKGVAAAVHTEWASELNERGNRLLSAFLPSLRRLRFENDLSFHVVGCGDDQEVADPATLSMGQRDQLYLAVRLGIAGFVAGRSGGLPLILDDPFVNFDDERFCRATRFIAEQATSAGGKAVPAHQILLFTCHRERFAWLRRKDPDWFDRHIFQREIPQSLEGEGRRTEDEG